MTRTDDQGEVLDHWAAGNMGSHVSQHSWYSAQLRLLIHSSLPFDIITFEYRSVSADLGAELAT